MIKIAVETIGCMLASPSSKELRPVRIKPDSTVFLGRNAACGICDIRCSRKQVQVDLYDGEITVTRLGKHPSYVGGVLLPRRTPRVIPPGTELHVLQGHRFTYRLGGQKASPQSSSLKQGTLQTRKLRTEPETPRRKLLLEMDTSSSPTDRSISGAGSSEEKDRDSPSLISPSPNAKHDLGGVSQSSESKSDVILVDLEQMDSSGSADQSFGVDTTSFVTVDKDKDGFIEMGDEMSEGPCDKSGLKAFDTKSSESTANVRKRSPKMLSPAKNSSDMETSSLADIDSEPGPSWKSNAEHKSSRPVRLDKSGTLDKWAKSNLVDEIEDFGDEEDDRMDEVQRKLQELQKTAAAHVSQTPKPATSNSAAVHPGLDADPGPVDVDEGRIGWRDGDHIHVYCPAGLQHRSKIAAFDLDGTLITTKSGRAFPQNTFDWQILYPEIPRRLKTLHADGYKLVVLSNQRGITKGHTDLAGFKRKVEVIVGKYGVPMQVFVSSGDGMYRKPRPGMWQELEQYENGGVTVSRTHSFYVGDAAGRDAAGYRKKKDFACSDRLLALNLGLSFHTPEEFFQGKSVLPFILPPFDPRALETDPSALLHPPTSVLHREVTEVILMVGYPGSGKSHFVQKHYSAKYEVVSQDALKTSQKCLSATESHLKRNTSVVVDNTNADSVTRKKFIDLARRLSVPARCFVMNVDFYHAVHNNRFRRLLGTDRAHRGVNEMVLNSFKAKFQHPVVEEGFEEIVRVNFLPHFEDHVARELYFMYLVEK